MAYFRFYFRANGCLVWRVFLLTFTSAYGQTYFISLFAGEIKAAWPV